MPDAHRGGHLNGTADHVAAPGHHELHVVHHLQHLLGGGDEILRTLLHRDAAEEQNDFLILVDAVLFLVETISVHINGVVNDFNLVRFDPVMMGDEILGQGTDGDHLHRAVHAATFDVVDALIDMHATSIELGRVNVNDQRDILQCRDGHSGGESHPVMGMHDIE